MTRSPTVGFDRRDWLRLLGSLASGGVVAFVALQGLLNTVLEPQLVAESVRRIDRNVRLVEVALDQLTPDRLPDAVLLRRELLGPERNERRLSDFDRRVIEGLRTKGLVRELRRDRPPLEDPWGGYWILLKSRPERGPLWLYQPERLSSLSVWYLPLLRSGALLLGMLSGVVFFLSRDVERPFRQVMQAIPDTSMPPLSLLPERGVAPLRWLTFRINRLLERLNAVARDRRLLLKGLAHDLAAPQARLMLQAELLHARLGPDEQRVLGAMLEELRQLAAITAQLGELADQTMPESRHEPIALDDFCLRLVASYACESSIQLAVPRLFVRLDLLALERSLCNLIDNALEYGRPPVLVSAFQEPGLLHLRVDDHGDGLRSPTLLTMPSSPRSDDRQRIRHQGLGLQLVDRFCRSQGGRLVLGRNDAGGLRADMLLRPTAENPLFAAD